MNTVGSILGRFTPCALAALLCLLATDSVQAVPEHGAQTGCECAKCHSVFPELTPFGRQFKLGAYAMGYPKWDAAPFFKRIPVCGLLQITRTSETHTDGATSEDFARDRETIVQAAGVYYGGKITDNSGALVQYNYDGIERKWAWRCSMSAVPMTSYWGTRSSPMA